MSKNSVTKKPYATCFICPNRKMKIVAKPGQLNFCRQTKKCRNAAHRYFNSKRSGTAAYKELRKLYLRKNSLKSKGVPDSLLPPLLGVDLSKKEEKAISEFYKLVELLREWEKFKRLGLPLNVFSRWKRIPTPTMQGYATGTSKPYLLRVARSHLKF